MANINWRTINIDALDPDSPANFDLSTLTPALAPVSTSEVQNLQGQVRQLLRGGDSEGALRGALESAPYGADERGKVRLASIHTMAYLSCGEREADANSDAVGSPPRDRHGDPAVHQAVGDVTHTRADIQVRGRHGSAGHAHEVHVGPSTIQIPEAYGVQVHRARRTDSIY